MSVLTTLVTVLEVWGDE